MAEDKKELSMDEILTSIRNILQETAKEPAMDKKPEEPKEDDDVFELLPSMMVNEPKAAEDKTFEIIEEDGVEEVVQKLEEEADISDDIEDEIGLYKEPGTVVEDTITSDISNEIIGSFAKLFNEQSPKSSDHVSYDADRLLESIVRKAVEEKISVELKSIESKIVASLDSWLKLYLPKIITKELERLKK